MSNQPSRNNILKWFDPRHRQMGSWAFILNRITALGLTLYLFLHLIMLGKLAQGPEAYNTFITFAHSPIIKIGEMLVIAGGIIHGLNGIRIGLTSFGIGAQKHKHLFVILMTVGSAAILYFALQMFDIF